MDDDEFAKMSKMLIKLRSKQRRLISTNDDAVGELKQDSLPYTVELLSKIQSRVGVRSWIRKGN